MRSGDDSASCGASAADKHGACVPLLQPETEQTAAAHSHVIEEAENKKDEPAKEEIIPSSRSYDRKQSHDKAFNRENQSEKSEIKESKPIKRNVRSSLSSERKRSHEKAFDGENQTDKTKNKDHEPVKEKLSSSLSHKKTRPHNKSFSTAGIEAAEHRCADSEDKRDGPSAEKQTKKKKELEQHICSVCEATFSTRAELQKHAFVHLRQKMREKNEKKTSMDVAAKEALLFRQRFKGITIPKLAACKRSQQGKAPEVHVPSKQVRDSSKQVCDSSKQMRDSSKQVRDSSKQVRDPSKQVFVSARKVRNLNQKAKDSLQHDRESAQKVREPAHETQVRAQVEQMHEDVNTKAKVAKDSRCGDQAISVWKETAFSANDTEISSIPLPSDTPDAFCPASKTNLGSEVKCSLERNNLQDKITCIKPSGNSVKVYTNFSLRRFSAPVNIASKGTSQTDHPKDKNQTQRVKPYTKSHTRVGLPKKQDNDDKRRKSQTSITNSKSLDNGNTKDPNSSTNMHKESMRKQYQDLLFFKGETSDFNRDFFKHAERRRTSTETPVTTHQEGSLASTSSVISMPLSPKSFLAKTRPLLPVTKRESTDRAERTTNKKRPYNSFREMICRGQKSPGKVDYRLYEGNWSKPNSPPPLMSMDMRGFIRAKQQESGSGNNQGFTSAKQDTSEGGSNEELHDFMRAKHIDWRQPEPFAAQWGGETPVRRVQWRRPAPVDERPAASIYSIMKAASPLKHVKRESSRSVNQGVLINVADPSSGPSSTAFDNVKQDHLDQGVTDKTCIETQKLTHNIIPYVNMDSASTVDFMQSSNITATGHLTGFTPSDRNDTASFVNQRQLYHRHHSAHDPNGEFACGQSYYPCEVPHGNGTAIVSQNQEYQPNTGERHKQVTFDYGHVSALPVISGPSSSTDAAPIPNTRPYSRPSFVCENPRPQAAPELRYMDQARYHNPTSASSSATLTSPQTAITEPDPRNSLEQPSVLNKIIEQYPNVVQQSPVSMPVALNNPEHTQSTLQVEPAAQSAVPAPETSEQSCKYVVNTDEIPSDILNLLKSGTLGGGQAAAPNLSMQAFTCYLCKAAFSTQQLLEAHMSCHVTDVQQYMAQKNW